MVKVDFDPPEIYNAGSPPPVPGKEGRTILRRPAFTPEWLEADRQRMLYPFVSPTDKCYLFGTWIVSILPFLALLGMIGVLVGGFLLLE